MRDLEHSGIDGSGLHNFFLPLFHILRHISSIDDEGSVLHHPEGGLWGRIFIFDKAYYFFKKKKVFI